MLEVTQQVVLILGPCFFSAGLYGLLGVIALHVAPSKAFFGPKKLAAAFVVVDLVCIAVQGAGGASDLSCRNSARTLRLTIGQGASSAATSAVKILVLLARRVRT